MADSAKPALPSDYDDTRSSFQRDANGLLARENFTPERTAYLMEQVAKTGLWTFISQEDRDASRAATLARHTPGADLWVFGYGSLMWNPALNVTESRKAFVPDYTRCFSLSLIIGRAMPDAPGLMLAIEPGGGMTGVVHRIDSDAVEAETQVLWMREMMSGAYTPTWVTAETDNGTVDAITFVINKAHARYAGELPIEDQAARIARAEGQAGNNRDYLYRCRRELQSMGVADPYVEALFSAVCRITGETGDPSPPQGSAP